MSRLAAAAILTGASLIAAPVALAGPDEPEPTHVDHGVGPSYAHDPAYADAKIQVHAWSRRAQTTVRLMANGLPADRVFGAHVHTQPCGQDPLASGGHYQHSHDPSVPLAEREVWLDLVTDKNGRAVSVARVPWVFTPGEAGSVVVHASATNPNTGAAGTRLLCTDVRFGE